jgi:hypothetical protein
LGWLVARTGVITTEAGVKYGIIRKQISVCMKYQATYNTKLQERTHKLHRKSRSRSMKRYNK